METNGEYQERQVIGEKSTGKLLRTLMHNYVYALLALTAVLFFLTRLTNLKGVPIQVDESIYISWGQYALAGHFGKSFLMGVPPLHQIALVPFLKIFSDPLVGARVCSVFFGFISLTTIVLLGREFHSLEAGAWAGLFWAVSPYAIWYERLGLIESMVIALTLLAVYFSVKAILSDNVLWLIGTAVFLGFAMWTKLTAELFFLVIPFAYLLRGTKQRDRNRKRPLIRWISSVILALLVSYGMYNLLRLSPKFSRLALYSRKNTMPLGQLLKTPFSRFTSNVNHITFITWRLAVPLLLIIGLLGIIAGLFLKWRGSYFLLCWFGIIMMVVSLITRVGAGSRYFMVLLPPLMLGAGYAVTELPRRLWALIRQEHNSASPALATGLIILLLVIALGIAVPAGKTDVNRVYHPERLAELQRSSWGWGYDQAIETIKGMKQQGKTLLTCNDSFTHTVLKDYGISIIPLGKALSRVSTQGHIVYFVGPVKAAKKLTLVDVRRYPDARNPYGLVFGRLTKKSS